MLTCDVCDKPALGVASSALGPISFAFCKECIDQDAEPAFMLACNLDMMDGNPDNLAEWVKRMKTFINGEYITFDEFFEKHYICIFMQKWIKNASTSSIS